MKRILTISILALALLPAGAPAADDPSVGQVLLLRHALLVGGRDASQVPISGEVRGADALAESLVEWEPGKETEEIRELFALEGLSEVIRQALVLPDTGGQSNAVYVHNGVGFEIRFDVRPGEQPEMTTAVEIRRDGETLTAPTIRTELGERAIVSTTNGPEAPFLFLVLEVDRVSSASVRQRGLKYAWRKDLMAADGVDVTAPRAVLKEPPAYTEPARKERIQGVVVLQLVIDEAGRVAEVDALKGLPHGLTESAIETVKRWKFEPARHDGKPVSVLYNITINFRLQKEKLPQAGEPDA